MSEEELVDSLKAVAHPLRLRIIRALTGAERNVGEIDERAQIGQPMLSQQLAVLRNAGLVKTRKDAKLVFYRLDQARLSALSDMLGGFAGLDDTRTGHARPGSPGAANFARLA